MKKKARYTSIDGDLLEKSPRLRNAGFKVGDEIVKDGDLYYPMDCICYEKDANGNVHWEPESMVVDSKCLPRSACN